MVSVPNHWKSAPEVPQSARGDGEHWIATCSAKTPWTQTRGLDLSRMFRMLCRDQVVRAELERGHTARPAFRQPRCWTEYITFCRGTTPSPHWFQLSEYDPVLYPILPLFLMTDNGAVGDVSRLSPRKPRRFETYPVWRRMGSPEIRTFHQPYTGDRLKNTLPFISGKQQKWTFHHLSWLLLTNLSFLTSSAWHIIIHNSTTVCSI